MNQSQSSDIFDQKLATKSSQNVLHIHLYNSDLLNLLLLNSYLVSLHFDWVLRVWLVCDDPEDERWDETRSSFQRMFNTSLGHQATCMSQMTMNKPKRATYIVFLTYQLFLIT